MRPAQPRGFHVAAGARLLFRRPNVPVGQGLSLCEVLIGRPDTRGFPRAEVRRISGTGERLRVGYVSSDLRDHAVGFALREVLELHDKARVEVFAYSIGDPAQDETQTRMKAVVDGWREMGAVSEIDIAGASTRTASISLST